MTGLVTGTVADGVLTVTLRRPEKRNAMNVPLLGELAAVFRDWAAREDVVVAVLTGEGAKAFASGGDVRELGVLREEAETLRFAEDTRAVLDTIRTFPAPVIAALNGDALGGGAELALACDLRIAAPHARIGFLQGRLNITTAWGGGTDLFRLLGSARAMALLCTAEALDAARALACGLVDAVAPAGEDFSGFVSGYVARIAVRKPQVTRAFKSLAIAHRTGASAAELAAIESRALARTWVHADHWAAVDATFSR